MKNKEGREISIWSGGGARGRNGGDEDKKLTTITGMPWVRHKFMFCFCEAIRSEDSGEFRIAGAFSRFIPVIKQFNYFCFYTSTLNFTEQWLL